MTPQGSDVNRPFFDKSPLFNIINDPLVSRSDDVTDHKHHLHSYTSQSGYKSLICPVVYSNLHCSTITCYESNSGIYSVLLYM